MGQQKSIAITYLLWAIGGPWGLHHMYLGRYRHAFLWITTLGGFLGLGWVRDVWRIPDYVIESNAGPDYVERMIHMMKLYRKPPMNVTRLVVQIAYGTLVGIAVVAGLPQDLIEGDMGKLVMALLIPLCTGLAVHLVANIGNEEAGLKWSLGGAYLIGVLFSINFQSPGSGITRCSLVAAIITNWKGKSWRRIKYKKPSKRLCLVLTLVAMIYGSLWVSAVLHNAYVTTSDGEKVRLKEAFGNIRASEAWQNPINTIMSMWTRYGATGFDGTWEEFIGAIDPEGERNAYQVLGVPPGSSEKELRSAYKQLARQYHPDKVSDPQQKIVQQEKFIAIQRAFDALSSIRNRRIRANKVNQDAKDK